MDEWRAADHGGSGPPPVSHRGCVGECAREGHPAVRTDPPIHRKRPGVAQPLLFRRTGVSSNDSAAERDSPPPVSNGSAAERRAAGSTLG